MNNGWSLLNIQMKRKTKKIYEIFNSHIKQVAVFTISAHKFYNLLTPHIDIFCVFLIFW